MDEWERGGWYVYMMEYYSAIQNEILPFAAAWLDLEGIMLVSQPERNKCHMIPLTCEI